MLLLRTRFALLLVSSYVLYCNAQPNHPVLDGVRKIDLSTYPQVRPSMRRLRREINTDPSTFKGAEIALCVVNRDDRLDLVEFLEYYKWLGVGRVYIYDNHSKPPLLSDPAVLGLVDSGYLQYTYFYTKYRPKETFLETPQGIGYNDCLLRSRGKHRWVMFFDADEFLVLPHPEKRNLTELLKEYESFGGIGVNWVIFSGKPHVKRPEGGVLKNYQYCLPASQWEVRHLKVIAQQHRTAYVGFPHWVRYIEPDKYWTVDENSERLPWPSVSPAYSVSKLALYHYTTRSNEDFDMKMARDAKRGGNKDIPYRDRMWESGTDICSAGLELSKVCCPSLLQDKAKLDNATDSTKTPA